MSKNNIVAVGNDHGGAELAAVLIDQLQSLGYEVLNLGVPVCVKAEYPEQAQAVVKAILSGKAAKGILVCGTGIGIAIAANRYKGITAALCHDEYTARLSRQHNNSNIVVMGGRTTGVEVAKGILNVWLNTEFEGGRHSKRLEMLENC